MPRVIGPGKTGGSMKKLNAGELQAYREVQAMAKETIRYIQAVVAPGMSLEEVRAECELRLRQLGADSFWYYDIGAFVFAGDETAKSMSGRQYATPESILRPNDLITIDLSPQRYGIWGDYARTIVLENGAVVPSVEKIGNDEWRSGLEMEQRLHRELLRFATPETTFEQLYEHMNVLIAREGFVNLDYLGNLGHSIEKNREDRLYTEKGNRHRLADTALFTFEPHISVRGSDYGYKMENIYYFEGDGVKEL